MSGVSAMVFSVLLDIVQSFKCGVASTSSQSQLWPHLPHSELTK